MANRLLRNIAVHIGEGLAAGFHPSLAAPQTRRQVSNLTPILTRIEDIESRVARVEMSPAPDAPSPEEIQALGTLVSSQSEDIAGLREAIERIEIRNAEQAEAFGQKVALVEQQVPAQIESSVNARMAELEQRLRGEFQEIHHKTIDSFVETIESRVIGRIAALEHSLEEQSQSIGALREKSLKTDDNLQRLLEAVEKLCARAEVQAQAVVPPTPPEPQREQDDLGSHYDRMWAQETTAACNVVEPEPELAFAGPVRNSPPPRRGGMRAVGVAVLGLAVLGFRLFR